MAHKLKSNTQIETWFNGDHHRAITSTAQSTNKKKEDKFNLLNHCD